jgi:hypothetical protein
MLRKALLILGVLPVLATAAAALAGSGQDPVPLYPDNY